MKKINFSGGEPFLKDNGQYVGELVRYSKMNLGLPSVTIVSNGSLITEDWFIEYGKYFLSSSSTNISVHASLWQCVSSFFGAGCFVYLRLKTMCRCTLPTVHNVTCNCVQKIPILLFI